MVGIKFRRIQGVLEASVLRNWDVSLAQESHVAPQNGASALAKRAARTSPGTR